MDNPLMFSEGGLAEVLEDLKKQAISTNKSMAKQLGIPTSAAITCVKPSGTVSQLVDSASGIHARHSPYYVRTVRADNKDPMTQFMIDSGVPAEPDAGKPESTTVFSFPFASPDDAISRNDRTAVEQLELWLMYQRHWCEHKPSITVTVRENEWLEVGAWVYKHFEEVSGISFLPFDGHVYKQAPYQDCDKKEYGNLQNKMPSTIDWERLAEYEKEDTTTGAQDLACSAGVCEVVDIQAL
jgi:ribonucleoside-diphosphate reductase alpha chain